MQQQDPQQPAFQPQSMSSPVAAGMNTMAIISLATGIGSWFLLPVIGAIIAIVTGHIAKREIRQTGQQGDTLATVGLVLGYLHLAVVAIIIVLVIAILVFGIALFGISSRTTG